MPLSPEHRAFLDQKGLEAVRVKLGAYGPGSEVQVGFSRDVIIVRADIEQWLAEKNAAMERREAAVLRWARIAGVAAVLGLIATVVIPFLMR
jgi:hypothetical protein